MQRHEITSGCLFESETHSPYMMAMKSYNYMLQVTPTSSRRVTVLLNRGLFIRLPIYVLLEGAFHNSTVRLLKAPLRGNM